jgi:hypothetical protein
MKGGGKIYPNEKVKIDRRAITSAKMPESINVYCGYLERGFFFIMGKGIITRPFIERENQRIRDLLPFSETKNKLKSSHWFFTGTHMVEFFRTSSYTYKIYAIKCNIFNNKEPYFLQTRF